MKLVTGGAFQGKKEYAKLRFGLKDAEMTDGALASFEEIFQCRCMYHFHEWVKKGLKEEWDLAGLADRLQASNPRIRLISNELGCGVVPVDAFDRKYRETAGRICTEIAAKSSQVIRVVCGIGTVLKDA